MYSLHDFRIRYTVASPIPSFLATPTFDSPQTVSISLPKDKPLTAQQKTQLQRAIGQTMVSAKTPWKPSLNPEALSSIQKIMLAVIRGNSVPNKDILRKDYLLGILWKENPEILGEAKTLINHLLVDLCDQLNKEHLLPSEQFHMEMIIGDLLSLYPFLGPKSGEKLQVPVLIDAKWQLTYNILQYFCFLLYFIYEIKINLK